MPSPPPPAQTSSPLRPFPPAGLGRRGRAGPARDERRVTCSCSSTPTPNPNPTSSPACSTRLAHRPGLLSVMPYHRMQRQYERLSAFFSVISLMGIGAGVGASFALLSQARTDRAWHATATTTTPPAVTSRYAARSSTTWRLRSSSAAPGYQSESPAGGARSASASTAAASATSSRVGARTSRPAPGQRRCCASCSCSCGWWAWAPPHRRLCAKRSRRSAGGRVPDVVLWIGFVAFAVQLAVQLRPLGNYSWAAVLFPIPLAAWFVIFLRSIVLTARGQVRWKGRAVLVRPERTRR